MENKHTIRGLFPRARTLRRATAALGAAALVVAFSAQAATAATVPDPPTGLTGTAGPLAGKVKLSWVAPANDGGSAITAYLYDVSTDGGVTFGAKIKKGTAKSTSVSCPQVLAKPCTFRVYARNAIGDSIASAPVTVPWAAPSAPKSLKATTTNFSDVSLSWTKPASTGGLAITAYTVQDSIDGGAWTTIGTGITGTTFAATASCTGTATCQYRTFATNPVGNGPVSNTATITVTSATVPGPPTGLAGTAGPTAGNVKLSWVAPASNGGSAITAYLYDVSTNGGVTFGAKIKKGTATSTSVSCPQVLANPCTYRVYARNAIGDSIASAPVTVPWAAPSAPVSLKATTNNFSDVNLSWTKPSSTGGLAITAYTVQDSNDGGAWTTIGTGITGTTFAATASCTGATTCKYRAFATNPVGDGPVSNTATVTVTPGAVKNLAVVKTADDPTVGNPTSGTSTFSVSWAAPTTGMVTGSTYELQECQAKCAPGSSSWSPSTPLVVTSPVARTCNEGSITCSYRVRATNSRGAAGAWTIVTYRPWAAYGLTAVSGTTTGTVTATWFGPGDIGPPGGNAEHYEIWVCTTACDQAANWSISQLAFGVEPQPVSRDIACATGTLCAIRIRFVAPNLATSTYSLEAAAVGS
ncbi:MAG TPA: fibronectin type III domain-containing protein [Acidimicrobiia bacterium]